MSIEEISEQIRKSGYLFDLSVKGKVLSKKNNPADIEALHGSLEEYFKKILAANNATQIEGAFYTPNGSSYKNRGFFLVETKTVATPHLGTTEIVAPATKSVATVATIEEKTNKRDMEFATKTDIENARLSERVIHLEKSVGNLEKQNSKLEKDNEELRAERNKLKLDLDTEQRKHDFDLREKEFAAAQDAKSGLGGITEAVSKINPDTIRAVMEGIATLKGIKPAEQTKLPASTKHADPEAAESIETLSGILSEQPADTVNKVAATAIILSSDKGKLEKIYNALTKQSGTNAAGQSTTGNEDNEDYE